MQGRPTEAVSVSQHLAALLESHRIECVVHGEQATLAERLSAIRATWYAGEKTGRLDVDVLSEDERQLQGAFAGTGSGEDGLQDALRNFISNSLHVLLSALQGQAERDQVMMEIWKIGEWRLEVHIGNLGLRGVKGRAPPLPAGSFSSIEWAIRTEPLDMRLHWSRHFFCALGNQRMVGALFDNQPWEAGMQNLVTLDWQDSQDHYSVRDLLTLKPLARATVLRSPRGVDGGSILVRPPFDEFDPYHTTNTATILRPLADGTTQMLFLIGKRCRDFQMRRTQDWRAAFSRAGWPPVRPWPWPIAGSAR